MNARLQRELCRDLGSDYGVLLFDTSVLRLSAGIELKKIFALKMNRYNFCSPKGKKIW